MNLSEPFIKRPVMTTLVMAGILVFGVVAYRSLPVSDLPPVDYPTISVSASVPGASPTTMAASVATPLEKQFSTIAGLEVITSTSFQGNTQIALQFALDREHRRGRERRAGRHHADHPPAAAEHRAAHLPEGGPVAVADHRVRAHVGVAQAVAARRVRAGDDRAAAVDGRGRGPGAGVRLAEVCRAGAARSPGDGGAADRHRRGERRDRAGEREPADRHPLGHRPRVRGAGDGSAAERRRSSVPSWWRGATAARCGWKTSAASSTACRTPRPRPGTRTTAASSSPSIASRAPTRSRWRRGCGRR